MEPEDQWGKKVGDNNYIELSGGGWIETSTLPWNKREVKDMAVECWVCPREEGVVADVGLGKVRVGMGPGVVWVEVCGSRVTGKGEWRLREWVFMAVSVAGQAKELIMYVNGEEAVKCAIGADLLQGVNSIPIVFAKNMACSITEVRIWKRARTREEIRTFMRTPLPLSPEDDEPFIIDFSKKPTIGISTKISTANGFEFGSPFTLEGPPQTSNETAHNEMWNFSQDPTIKQHDNQEMNVNHSAFPITVTNSIKDPTKQDTPESKKNANENPVVISHKTSSASIIQKKESTVQSQQLPPIPHKVSFAAVKDDNKEIKSPNTLQSKKSTFYPEDNQTGQITMTKSPGKVVEPPPPHSQTVYFSPHTFNGEMYSLSASNLSPLFPPNISTFSTDLSAHLLSTVKTARKMYLKDDTQSAINQVNAIFELFKRVGYHLVNRTSKRFISNSPTRL